MKYLKLFENFNREDIDSICKKWGIKNYTINDDGSIDVDLDVDLDEFSIDILDGSELKKLPLKFRNVSGNFDCYGNDLTTLDGCPVSVGGCFDCHDNKLTSLEGCPEFTRVYLDCGENEIRTFEGFPRNIGGYFYCESNPVYELWKLFEDKDKVELFNDFGITDGEVVILERLNEFLEMIGKPTLTYTEGLEKEGYKII